MMPEIRKVVAKYTLRDGESKKEWSGLVSPNYTRSPEGLLDLLSKLLVYDYNIQVMAKQAIQHPFFDSVWDRVDQQIQEKVQTIMMQGLFAGLHEAL
jgi:serine/threonine protein kinase